MRTSIQAADVNVNNDRTVTGHSAGTAASNWDSNSNTYLNPGTAGSRGTFVATQNWFGLSANNNIVTHLNTGTGYNVNIGRLDYSSASYGMYNGGQDGSGHTEYYGWNYSPSGAANPNGMASTLAYQSSFGGDVTVAAGETTTLTATYGTIPAAVPVDQLFTITSGNNVAFGKVGGGMLSTSLNMVIERFRGDAGTLLITGTTGSTNRANISSTNAAFNGGNGTNLTDFGQHSLSSFTVKSGELGDVNSTSANANVWQITNLGLASVGDQSIGGFNNLANISVSANAVLNATNNIGLHTSDGLSPVNNAGKGLLQVTGTTTFGSFVGTNVLNIQDGTFISTGLFNVGTVADSTSYINAVWANGAPTDSNVAIFQTNNGTTLAAVVGSTVVGNITNGNTWENNGAAYIVGEAGTATVNIYTTPDTNPPSIPQNERAGIVRTTEDAVIGDDATALGIVNVWGGGSQFDVSNTGKNLTLMTGDEGRGNMYVWGGASTNVKGDHIIANAATSTGRDQIDGIGTTMTVTGTITVGMNGAAGGWYQEENYHAANDHPAIADPNVWLPSFDYNTHTAAQDSNMNVPLTDPTATNAASNPKYGSSTGNAPGLAITRGGIVTSGYGVVGANTNYDNNTSTGLNSNGYVVIDNRDGGYTVGSVARSTWHVTGVNAGTNAPTNGGTLTIGREGDAFVRVIHGGLLKVDGITKILSSDEGTVGAGNPLNNNHGTLHVYGDGSAGDKLHEKDNNFASSSFSDGNYVRYAAATPYGARSQWISSSATVIGEVDYVIDTTIRQIKRGTIRINDGGYGETKGLYIGLTTAAAGEVSVTGAASELHVLADTTSPYQGTAGIPKGSSLLSVSDEGFVQIHTDAVIKLNGIAMISNDSILHLDENSLLDSISDKISIVNARLEGIGTVTGANGVFVTQDSVYTTGNAVIDPGLAYGWEEHNEDPRYYGTLTFGDQLLMTGNVTTNFDVNSGYLFDPKNPGPEYAPGVSGAYDPKKDLIVIKRSGNSASHAQIYARLSGTLNVHARLTDYYEKNVDFLAVQTIGRDATHSTDDPGRIISIYDTLKVMPSRFFEGIGQELRRDGYDNDQLWITMKRNDHPFSDAGGTYNQTETGKGLDSVYMDQIENKRKDWLPVLRGLWYLDDPDFLNAYRSLSGEVRAHTLQMPMQSPWTYAHDRYDYRACDCPEHLDPCTADEMAKNFKSCSSFSSRLKRCTKDARVWADFIYDYNDIDSDGNAGQYNFNRLGIVIGADKPISPRSHIGVQFAYNKSKLDTYQAHAEANDYNLGLYHATKICDNWEWKNYLGAGYQQYDMVRDLGFKMIDLVWNGTIYEEKEWPVNGKMFSAFNGYSFYANSELAHPYYYGKCKQYMVRPYFALDLTSIWQGEASESGNFDRSYLVALDYLANSYVRLFGRPGVTVERNGRCSTIHGGLSYSFLMGGQQYTSVNNRFQIGGNSFNIHGVDEEGSFLNLNFGGDVFFGKRKQSKVKLDYWGVVGERTTSHAVQLGFQTRF